MRRFTIYLLIALITFGIGSFVAFKCFWKTENDSLNTLQKTHSEGADKVESHIQENNDSRDFTCDDNNIKPLWKALITDESFSDWVETLKVNVDCRKDLEIKEVDLNSDGKKEFVIRGDSSCLCGATGNCGFWIYQKNGNQYHKLLSDTSYLDYLENEKTPDQIQKSKTKGYFDVHLKVHFTGYETSFSSFKFNGQKYIETKCIVEEFYANGERHVSTCQEWRKRSDKNLNK